MIRATITNAKTGNELEGGYYPDLDTVARRAALYSFAVKVEIL